ncbi:MAG: hypothetical protein P8K78_09680 [Pirellulales bacterium]|nr:hypothetical protein [Pirellulales bacterium]
MSGTWGSSIPASILTIFGWRQSPRFGDCCLENFRKKPGIWWEISREMMSTGNIGPHLTMP